MTQEATKALEAEGARGRTGAWPACLRGARAAVVHLTRFPAGGFPYSDEDWRWSAAHLPLVGAGLGVVLAAVWMACARAGDFVAAVVVLAASLLATGAMHEDGLADTADALGGGAARERVLAILKDSRIGSFGGAALTVTILLRVALLARLGPFAPWALVLTAAASRLAPVLLMATLPYVTDPSTSKSLAIVRTGAAQVIVAAAWVLALAVGLGFIEALTIPELASSLAAMVGVTAVCGARFRARVGGITGDFLGATQQLSECAMLLALALVRGGAP